MVRRSYLLICWVLAVASIVAVALALPRVEPPPAVGKHAVRRSSTAKHHSVEEHSSFPAALEVAVPPDAASDVDGIATIIDRFRIGEGADVAKVVHALHVFSQEPSLLDRWELGVSDLEQVLLDQTVAAKWYKDELFIVRTGQGLRFVTGAGGIAHGLVGQPHIDQIAALFGELRLPASTLISVTDGAATIDDVLRESSSNFRLAGEFEWSVLVRARYFPSCRTWTNRFGESYDFDDVCRALIAKPLDRGSCGGTHALYALAAVAQICADAGSLSPAVAKFAGDYLRATGKFLVDHQLPNGSFEPHWYCEIVRQPWHRRMVADAVKQLDAVAWLPSASRDACSGSTLGLGEAQHVLVTGHHLEWMMLLPVDAQPPPIHIRRAAGLLKNALAGASELEIKRNYCPYSHALAVLLALRRSGGYGGRQPMQRRRADPVGL